MTHLGNHRHNQSPILSARELTVGYQKSLPLTSLISFDLRPGEFCCLTGPNGSGKTTLMKTLAGFQKPLGGVILLNGKTHRQFTNRELARQLGIVLTDRPEMDRTTVFEVVAMGRQPYTGISGRIHTHDREIIMHSLELVGMAGFKNHFFGCLSDGEKQKTMIAKALAQQTPLILLDEPASFLDFPSRSDIMYLLRNLAHSWKWTVLVSTHDVSLALRLADRLLMMAPGKPFRAEIPEIYMAEQLIPGYFSHQGLLFDESICEFVPDSSHHPRILLEGNSSLFPVIRNLLCRKGLNPVTEGEASLRISIETQNLITLWNKDAVVKFPSLPLLNEYFDNEVL